MKTVITTTQGMELPSLIKPKIWLGLALIFFTVNFTQAQVTPTEGDIILQGGDATLITNTSGITILTADDGSNDEGDTFVDNFGDGIAEWSYGTITSAEASNYTMNYRVASNKSDGGLRIQISKDGGSTFTPHETNTFPGTGGWTTFVTVSSQTPFTLAENDNLVIRADKDGDAFNLNWIGLVDVGSCPPSNLSGSFDDGSGSIDGTEPLVAENEGIDITLTPHSDDTGSGSWSWAGPNSFTASTQDITISDVTALDYGTYTVTYDNSCATMSTLDFEIAYGFPNDGTYYQGEDFTAQSDVVTEVTSDIGGGLNAASINEGDYMEFEINVPTTGLYNIEYRLASNTQNEEPITYTFSTVDIGDVLTELETVSIPNTGGWQNWETAATGVPISLTAGIQTIRLGSLTPRNNLNWFRVIGYDVVWDGETSTDWHTATNWGGDVLPTSSDNVLIVSETNEPIITSSVNINSINIASSATLTVSSGGAIDIAGDVMVNGSFVVESGASLMTYEANTVLGNTVGDVTINRNTTFADGKYSFVGSPIAYGAIGADLGSFVYSYDETQAYNAIGGDRWVDASAADLVPGVGYTQAGQEVISFTGMPNSGDVTVADLTYTTGTAAEQGWALLSNPYAAAIDVVDFLAGNADLDDAIYLWDDGGSDTGAATDADYITANSIGTVAGPNTGSSFEGYIGSMQGFFVKLAAEGTADVTFTESMRVSDNNTDGSFFRQTKDNDALNIKLSISSESGLYNEMLVGLRSDATLGKDRIYDAGKLAGNDNLQFYSLIEDSKYAIQGLPLESGVSTELAFDLGETAELKLSVVEMTGIEEGMTFYITDKETGLVYDLNTIDAIDFSGLAGTDQNRFSLSYSASNSVLDIESLAIQPIYRYLDNELTVKFADSIEIDEVVVYDISGQILLKDSSKSIGNELKISIENKGINIVKLRTSQGDIIVEKFLF